MCCRLISHRGGAIMKRQHGDIIRGRADILGLWRGKLKTYTSDEPGYF